MHLPYCIASGIHFLKAAGYFDLNMVVLPILINSMIYILDQIQ